MKIAAVTQLEQNSNRSQFGQHLNGYFFRNCIGGHIALWAWEAFRAS